MQMVCMTGWGGGHGVEGTSGGGVGVCSLEGRWVVWVAVAVRVEVMLGQPSRQARKLAQKLSPQYAHIRWSRVLCLKEYRNCVRLTLANCGTNYHRASIGAG